MLAAGEQPVGRIVELLADSHPMSQPAVSQHLKVLRDAGLVTVRAEGTRRVHAVDAPALESVRRWMADLVATAEPACASETFGPVEAALDALATEVARGRRARRSAQTLVQPSHDVGGATTA